MVQREILNQNISKLTSGIENSDQFGNYILHRVQTHSYENFKQVSTLSLDCWTYINLRQQLSITFTQDIFHISLEVKKTSRTKFINFYNFTHSSLFIGNNKNRLYI